MAETIRNSLWDAEDCWATLLHGVGGVNCPECVAGGPDCVSFSSIVLHIEGLDGASVLMYFTYFIPPTFDLQVFIIKILRT